MRRRHPAHACTVLDDVDHAVVGQNGHGQSRHLLQRRLALQGRREDGAGFCEKGEPALRRLRSAPRGLFRREQPDPFLFRLLPLRDVPEVSSEDRRLVGQAHHVDGQLDGKLATIGPQCGQLESPAQYWPLARGEVVRHGTMVPLA